MTLFRLDHYQDDMGDLAGFFTSKEAALEYSFYDRQVSTPTRRSWSEIWEFKYNGNIDLDEKLDGRISTKAGLQAWEKGQVSDNHYYE